MILLLMIISIQAEIPTYISYQGRLLDSNGDPMTDVEHDIVLNIYVDDVTPTPLWSSGILTGTPSDGLFSIHLGPIPSSVFTEGSQRYLGITIDSDPEMTPRTEITSVPYAYRSQVADTAEFANNIQGVSTQPGSMLINNDIGDSAIVLSSELASNLSRIYMIDPVDDGKLLELVGNHSTNEVGIHLIDPVDDGHTISITSSLNAGSFKMFNPQPEPPAVLFEMNASTETGATFNIYDDIGKVMSTEPSPFNSGYSINLIDPVDDGKLLELVGNHSTNEAGIYLIDPVDDGHTISITSALNTGSIKMFNPQPEPPALMFDVNADATTGPSMNFLNSFGPVMTAEHNMTGGFSIKMEDPDEEPVQMHVELGSSFSIPAKSPNGTDGGFLSLYNPTDLLQTQLYAGNLIMKFKDGGTEGPPIFLNTSSTDAQIGIGTSTPTEALYVMGNIYATGSITELSDESVKTNVETINNALDIIDNLRGVRYNLNAEIAEDLNTTDDKQIGLIAQEVKQILPEVVNSPKEGYSSVDYSRLTAVLIEAVKELKAENEKLHNRVDKLEGR
jgi:endosialidase-like protein